jgi:hypothetical protein
MTEQKAVTGMLSESDTFILACQENIIIRREVSQERR